MKNGFFLLFKIASVQYMLFFSRKHILCKEVNWAFFTIKKPNSACKLSK